jgi:hypothetical protein
LPCRVCKRDQISRLKWRGSKITEIAKKINKILLAVAVGKFALGLDVSID